MRQAVEFFGIVNLVLFAAIAVVCVRQWRRERAVTALWATLAFVTLAWVLVASRLLPTDPENLAEKVLQRIDLAILLLFPYLLYRFAVAFEPGSRPLARVVDALSATLVTATLVLPSVPADGEAWPWWFVAYAVAFVVHWSVLLTIVAVRLWRAARDEASVARKRMRMLAFASSALTAALVFSLAAGDEGSVGALLVALLATLSGVAFLLGFAPPSSLRLLWRRPEQNRMQDAIGELMSATSVDDVAARVLPPMASMVGARGISLESSGRNADRHVRRDRRDDRRRRAVGVSVRATGRPDEHLRAVLRRRGAEAADVARLAHRSRARPGAPLHAGARRP